MSDHATSDAEPPADVSHVEVRFYGGLDALAGGPILEVPFGEPRSVKDLIESVGVPHPEVALILVDGRSVDFDHPVGAGERVAVFPPFRNLELPSALTVEPPPLQPRFVLDVHLGTLTRRLRLLGFDCWYRTDADDAELAEVAVEDQRILLTRDRQLLMRRVITHGYCPRSDDPDLQALEVIDRFDLAGRVRPFTRCVNCNGRLAEVDKDDVLDEIPPQTRVDHHRFTRCQECGQIYWPGSHRDAVAGFVAEASNAS